MTSTATATVTLAAAATSRSGLQAWPLGPAVGPEERKAYTEPILDYLDWLAEFEGVSPTRADFIANSRSMRRLYYNKLLGGVGAKFDMLFGTTGLGAPIQSTRLPLATLERLYCTDNIAPAADPYRPPAHLVDAPLDVSHIFAALDWDFTDRIDSFALRALVRINFPGLADKLNAAVSGLVTWVGDLASWFVEWNSERLKASAEGKPWTAAQAEDARKTLLIKKMPLEDVLGDVDAQVITAMCGQSAGTATSLVSVLRGYYVAPPVAGVAHRTTRWSAFLAAAQPSIPHTGAALAPEAANEIEDWVRLVVWVFLTFERRPKLGIRAAASSAKDDITANEGVLAAIVADWVTFLSAALKGSDPVWPSEFLKPLADRYGGFCLQLGDSDTTKTYGSVAQPASAGGYVRKLQDDLTSIGITCAHATVNGASNGGEYDKATQWAVRHLQGYGSLPGIGGVAPGKSTTAQLGDGIGHFHTPRRYRGPVHGVLTPETATTIVRWTQEITQWSIDAAGNRIATVACASLQCPVTLESWIQAAGAPQTRLSDRVWLNEDVIAKDAVVYARDCSQHYTIPAAHIDSTTFGTPIGSYYVTQNDGSGPVSRSAPIPNTVWGADLLVTPLLLAGRTIEPTVDLDLASVFRVVSAVATLECGGWFDSLNGWDSARISLGVAHWAMWPAQKVGELFAFLSYVKSASPQAYSRYLGVFGVQPSGEWSEAQAATNPLWDPSERKYVLAPGLYGLPDANGAPALTTLSPLDPAHDPACVYDYDRLRDWHWWYRFVMMCRDSADVRHAMWYMARRRIRDILATPWANAVGPGVPTVPDPTGTRSATFGEVFTSEHNVALVYRYHVNYPPGVIRNGVAGTSTVAALTAAAIGNLDTSTWRDAEQAALLTALKANPPASFADVKAQWDRWFDPTFGKSHGALLEGAGSFRSAGLTL